MNNDLQPAIDGIDTELKALNIPEDERTAILADVRAKAVRQKTARQSHELNVAFARSIHRTRLIGNQLMGGRVMCDPKFEMLLEMFVAQHEERRVSISDLCFSAATPQSTGLRHFERLEADGFVTRRPDLRDGRRSWVEPTARATNGVAAYMTELRRKI